MSAQSPTRVVRSPQTIRVTRNGTRPDRAVAAGADDPAGDAPPPALVGAPLAGGQP